MPLDTRQQIFNDDHRPIYHFLPPTNWMNDPNGLIQWKGKYHLFYQHNPFGPLWGNMSWGHAMSEDLIHWRDLPIALGPTPGGPDEAGCFSGCCVDNHGEPTILYTATSGQRHEVQVQSLATSKDNLVTWSKYAHNPIIADVPVEAGQNVDFRDPFVWKEADGWSMVLGSSIKDKGGVVFLYRSDNLINWDYVGPLFTGDQKKHGTLWECPNFFKLGDKWVLLISAHSGLIPDTVFYFVGSYNNYQFTPEYSDVFDYGNLYAPLTFVDDAGRRILFGWLREARSEVDQRFAGWSGVQSAPRVLTLDNQNHLRMSPVSELARIRQAHVSIAPMNISEKLTLDVDGLALDIEAEIDLCPGGYVGFSLACSEDDTERIDIIYEASRSRLTVHKVFPRTNGALTTHSLEVPHALDIGENLRLRILLDHSVVEIIANERTSLTRRIYPESSISNQVKLFGSNARVETLNIWQMASIWD